MDQELTQDSILNILNSHDESEEQVDKENEPVAEEEYKDDILKDDNDDKEQKEDDDQEEDEEVDPVERDLHTPVKRQEILKAYPDIFKKFPSIESSIYRDKQFTEVFPTPEDAKEASEDAKAFQQFSDNLLNGDPSSLLQSLKDTKPEALQNVANNFIDSLMKVSPETGDAFIENIIARVLNYAHSEGKNRNIEVLQQAASVLNQFIFNSTELRQPKQNAPKNDTESEKLRAEREEFQQQKFNDAKESLDTKITNVIKSTVINNIDQTNVMTDYVRKVAVNEVMDNLEKALQSDSRFVSTLERLWEQAAKENFSKESIDRINKATTSKAKTLLPQLIKKSRNAALKGLGKKVVEEKVEPETRKGSNINPQKDVKSKDISKMSTLDFLMRDS